MSLTTGGRRAGKTAATKTPPKPRAPHADAEKWTVLVSEFNDRLSQFSPPQFQINHPIAVNMAAVVLNKGYRRATLYRDTPLELIGAYAGKTGIIFKFELIESSFMGNTQSLVAEGVQSVEANFTDAGNTLTDPSFVDTINQILGRGWYEALNGKPSPFPAPVDPNVEPPIEEITTLPDWGSW